MMASRLTSGLVDDTGTRLYYTKDEIRSIVAFAEARGVRVMPDVDLPAHSSGWWAARSYGVQFCDTDSEDASFHQLYVMITTSQWRPPKNKIMI